MTDASLQSGEQAPPPPPAPLPPPPPPQQGPPWLVIAIVAIVLGVIAFGYFAMNNPIGGGSANTTYAVQPYTPPGELVAARERVEARAAPDAASPAIVMFGQGATLNVTGRVSRGLGEDWYAISWNNRTAFVRTQDAVAGSGAPPVAEERPQQPEEEVKPAPDEEVEQFPDIEDGPAQPEPSASGFELSNVNWIRAPNARDFARFYPDRALDDGQSGRVVLDCVAQPDGRLDCSVTSETPSGYGFGNAALGISHQVRIQPTLPDGRSVAGGHMRLPLAFRAG